MGVSAGKVNGHYDDLLHFWSQEYVDLRLGSHHKYSGLVVWIDGGKLLLFIITSYEI